MEIIHLNFPNQLAEPADVVFALGYFDGVHRGHQAVILAAQQLAEEQGAELAVMTFHPHPKAVLGQAKITQSITPLEEKALQFEKLGVKRLYVCAFDQTLSQLTAKQFVELILKPLGTKGVVTGFNFRFGQGAKATGIDLAQLGADFFETRVVQPELDRQNPVSSTMIRQMLDTGDVEQAKRLLGRYYTFQGRVITGDQRGRVIGFPTANIELLQPYLIPQKGVYVVRCVTENGAYHGMMNIGVRPTFNDPKPKLMIEVHLFQFSGDLYGQTLRVECLHRLRSEQKFASVDQLIAQLGNDREQAEHWLATRLK